MVKVLPAPEVPSKVTFAFLLTRVLNRSTTHSELLCRLMPSKTPESSLISNEVNIYVDAAPLVRMFRCAFFSMFGSMQRNGMTERNAASCWKLQSPTYISMDFKRSVICPLRHRSSSYVRAEMVMNTDI